MTRNPVFLLSPTRRPLAVTLLLGLLLLLWAATAGAQMDLNRVSASPELLRSYGIDPSDTAAAIRKAREMGIPEDQITRLLEQARAQSGVQTSAPNPVVPTVEAHTEPMETVSTDKPAQEPPETKPVAAGGPWPGLSFFGYDIFRAGKERVLPVEVGPVDPGYIVGAGDVLKLSVWGDVEFQYELEVESDGTILVPEAGQIFVSGTRMEDLRESMNGNLSRYYSGLAATPPTVFFDVSIARPHGSQIYIMGEVDRPGAYTLSAYATSFNAMYAIGGPLTTGSLRDVRILRGGGIEAHIDLYDYLVKGISTDDRRLQHNDIVFVPPRGKTVGIQGEVNRPGVYELLEAETIHDLVRFAGRLKPTAYTFRAQITRIKPPSERGKGELDREIVDVNLSDPGANVALADGDLVEIFPISDRLQNYVELVGTAVFRPGRYQLDRISTLAQLVAAAEGLTPYAITDRAEIIRTRDDMTREFIKVNLAAALSGDAGSDPVLHHMDTVRVFSKHDLVEAPRVSLNGHVKRPGTYPLPDNLSLYSLLYNYAGLQDSLYRAHTFMLRGDIFRLEGDGQTRMVIPFDVRAVWDQADGSDIALKARDEVVLYAAEVADLVQRYVNIDGRVKRPGRYEWKRNMILADLLRECGGFDEGAMFLEAEVARMTLTGLPGDSLAQIIRVPVAADAAWLADPERALPAILRGETEGSRFALEPYDRISIRVNPEFDAPGTVTVSGQVVYPGTYTLEKRNESLYEIIQRAGGLTSSAYAGGGQLFRNGRRLYLDFASLLEHNRRREDVTLQSGDSIAIPTEPNTVLVTGEVLNPGFFKHIRGASTRDYLAMAGGRTENGGKILVQQPSGRSYRYGWFAGRTPMDGAVVTVLAKPPKAERKPTDWSLIIKDTFAITASATTIIVLASQINK